MVCHLLPFLVYQPSLTAISIDTAGDSMRSPVSFSIAQATQILSTMVTFFVTTLRLPLSQTVSVRSTVFSPSTLMSKRSGEKRPQPFTAAMIHCDDQDGRPSTM
ncbi:hypothetical protein D9M72_183290 [compost metagenome]